MVSYFDAEDLKRRLADSATRSPDLAWQLALIPLLAEHIGLFPPITESEIEFINDFFYPH